MASTRITAPAKLNLFLHVTGKRADGYHLLESLTAFTEFGDELDIAPAETVSLHITGNYAGLLQKEDNLVLRAARLLQAEAGIMAGAQITLHKNIPVGAGLGGGSADAAATLTALSQLWSLALPPATLHKIALQLGSDVPACLLGSPGWLTGTGDNVAPVAIPPGGWVVLANPGQPLLTADVFRARRGSFDALVTLPAQWENIPALAAWASAQGNALEAPALTLMPVIAEVLAALASTENCLLPRMSGSGATCFGLYAQQNHATAAAAAIRSAHPGWWLTVTPLKGAAHGQAQ